MSDNVTDLWTAVEASPRDDALKLALADALYEADDGDSVRDVVHPRDVAHVVKLLVKNRRWPKYYQGSAWLWTSGSTGEIPKTVTNVLPSPWFLEFKKTQLFVLPPVDVDRSSCRYSIYLLTSTLVRLRNQMDASW